MVGLLTAVGHDSVHVHDLDLLGHVDDEVLEAAREDSRVLVSADTDFGELLALSGAGPPSLVLFRQGNRDAEHRLATLLANMPEIVDDLNAGAVVVFTEDLIRIRRHPVR